MKSISIILGIVGLIFSCSPSTQTTASSSTDTQKQVVEVDHYLQACMGEGPMLCERYRPRGEVRWQRAYDGIEGFDFEWGVRQILELQCEGKGISSCTLSKVLEKNAIPEGEKFQLKMWDESAEVYLYADSTSASGYTYFGEIDVWVHADSLKKQLQASPPRDGKAKLGTFVYTPKREALILQSIL